MITWSNLKQFAKLFHHYKRNEICKRCYIAIHHTLAAIPSNNKTSKLFAICMVNTTKLFTLKLDDIVNMLLVHMLLDYTS